MLYYYRYGDHRVRLFTSGDFNSEAITAFTHLECYGAPVELEPVGGLSILGFEFIPVTGRLQVSHSAPPIPIS